jgi:hypothetical protein
MGMTNREALGPQVEGFGAKQVEIISNESKYKITIPNRKVAVYVNILPDNTVESRLEYLRTFTTSDRRKALTDFADSAKRAILFQTRFMSTLQDEPIDDSFEAEAFDSDISAARYRDDALEFAQTLKDMDVKPERVFSAIRSIGRSIKLDEPHIGEASFSISQQMEELNRDIRIVYGLEEPRDAETPHRRQRVIT